ncbi:MAG TPA: hypothetical protein VMW54_00175 [Terriglobia bacterium]|nr:hypothetical protein [Terriglobia bacterium]
MKRKTNRREFLETSAALAGYASLAQAAQPAFSRLSGDSSSSGRGPAMLCYSVQPNGYLDDHAAEIKKIYDGFFFTVGSWERFDERFAGVNGVPPEQSGWVATVRKNLESLRAAGVTENFLDVAFEQDGGWPSAQSLLTKSFTGIMETQFAALGRLARELGFRGVAIDIEYPYRRYDLSNPIYGYDDYTAGDLTAAAFRQGQRSAAALLDAFPEAAILLLPGDLRSSPIGRAYQLGVLDLMSTRDAPGGFHLASEYSYCLADPVTTLATTRFEDGAVALLAGERAAEYWKRRCTIAPGVWPLHCVETGGMDYPVQPWKDEVRELRRQMAILRTTAKRYIWSFTASPVWYLYSPELEKQYGLPKQNLKRPDINLKDWQQILMDKPALASGSRLGPLVEAIRRFDRGELSANQLCETFGTPGRWWILGLLGNAHTLPQFAALEALERPIQTYTPYPGRDQAVRWFPYSNFDPRGLTDCRYIFDWLGTDKTSAHFVTFVENPTERAAVLQVAWDDAVTIRLGNKVVFESPHWGGYALYRDKYRFVRSVPIRLERGRSKLTVTSSNDHGSWRFALRFTDEHGIPLPGLRFRLA